MNTDSACPASDRTQTNIDTFIAPAPEAGGITLRPFSAGTLTICRALGLTMVVGGDKEQVEALSKKATTTTTAASGSTTTTAAGATTSTSGTATTTVTTTAP